jgi:uncharacterized protein YjbI with pentapeptide repeats
VKTVKLNQINKPILTAMLGKTIVLSGKFERGEREYLQDLTEAQQGIVKDDLDSKVDILVLADAAAGKTIQKKAASLNARGAAVQTINKDAFLQLIQPSDDQVLALIRGGNQTVDLFHKVFDAQKHRYHFMMAARAGKPSVVTLTSENFDGLNLQGFKFSQVYFKNCSFIATHLEGTRIELATDCDFSKAFLGESVLRDVSRSKFTGCMLQAAQFQSASIEDADFSHANLERAAFNQWQFRRNNSPARGHVRFVAASLKGAKFNHAALNHSDFTGADCTDAEFNGCDLNQTDFSKAILAGTRMLECKLHDALFANADLSNADLSESELIGASLHGADLKSAMFSGAKLDRVDFSGAKNYNPQPVAVVGSGPSLTELDNLAQQARRIHLMFEIQKGSQPPEKIGVDSARLKWGWGTIFNNAHSIRRQSVTTMSAAMQFLATRFTGSKIRYETLEVKSTKSAKVGKELRELVMNAIAETFAQPLPPAAELAAATRAYRELTAETKSVDRERLQKAKELAEKQKKTAKRQIAKKIEKEVGKVTDIATFLKALELRADKSKIDKATKMLKAEKFQLFNDITDAHLNGVVKSQTDADLVYACRIESNGQYACCTQNLNICGGLRGSICKHLLVLIIGLVKAGQLDPSSIDTWIAKTHDTKPELNKETMGEIFIRYKGAEAGEVDWRPTETVPEDYYAV